MDSIGILQKVKENPRGNDRILTCRIPAPLLKKLHDLCKEEQLYLSPVVKELVQEFVDSYEKIRFNGLKKIKK